MSMPSGELTGDTLVSAGEQRPDLRPDSDDSIDRPMPADAPGTRDAGGWDRIDDVDGGEAAGWRQC